MATQVHQISQREAARLCLASGDSIEENKLYRTMMEKYELTLRQARQGVKNSINSDGTIFRSTFNGRIYCRLANAKAPFGHLDFGTSPVDVKMNREQHAAFIAKRDAPASTPWQQDWTPETAIEQVESCGFECVAGSIQNSAAWRWIKEQMRG